MRIFISGPSGVGKSTIISEVLKRNEDIGLSISYTTRSPRKGEIQGKDYFFIPKETFEEMIEHKAFLEWANVHGHLYGTSLEWVEAFEKSGKHILFDIDVQGVAQARGQASPGCFILVLPPSREELSRRLGGRGTEDEQALTIRLDNARQELKSWRMYDYLVVNDDIDKAISDIQSIIDSLRCSREEIIEKLPWLQKIE